MDCLRICRAANSGNDGEDMTQSKDDIRDRGHGHMAPTSLRTSRREHKDFAEVAEMNSIKDSAFSVMARRTLCEAKQR